VERLMAEKSKRERSEDKKVKNMQVNSGGACEGRCSKGTAGQQ